MDPAHILIVEDELIVALELEERLQHAGYAIAGVVRTHAEALATVERARVDLVLLDVRLAGARDGIELAEDLHPWELPIVFLTAHGDADTLRRVKAVHAQGYLLKPFNTRLLELTIETALHRHAAERARWEAERARQRSEAVQSAILNHTPEAVLVVEEGGAIELANEAAKRMFELEAHGAHSLGELLPELPDPGALAREPSPRSSTHARSRAGRRFPIEFSVGIAPLEDGRRLVVLARDISAQRELESALARARELELVGRLASGVAHDINNLLSIVGITSYLLRDVSDAKRRELLEDLDAAVELGEALTRRLLTLARRDPDALEQREVEVNEVLRQTARLLRRCVGLGVRIELALDPEVGTVLLDPVRLEQVILNLGINANRAMPDGGRLGIRSSSSGSAVVIEIEDTGVGIPAELHQRIFEPFFTTRTDAGGTGLGLALVKDIIEQAGGALALDSHPGEGSRFELRLPRRDGPPQPRGADRAAAAVSLSGGGRRALVVDDDALHRRGMVRLLHAWGFEVTPASGPGEALLIAERSKAKLDVALVDVDMPLMNGFELAARLSELRSELPILMVSGSLESLEPGRSVLRKPLIPRQLQRALASISTLQEQDPCPPISPESS